jgi:hypothetical protein
MVFTCQWETEDLLAFLGTGICHGHSYLIVGFRLGPVHKRQRFGRFMLKLRSAD